MSAICGHVYPAKGVTWSNFYRGEATLLEIAASFDVFVLIGRAIFLGSKSKDLLTSVKGNLSRPTPYSPTAWSIHAHQF